MFIYCAAVLNGLCCIFLQKQQGDLVTQFMLALGMQFKHFGSYLFCCNLKMHTIFVVNATHKTVVNRRSWPHGLKHLHCYFISLMFILVPIISRGSYFDMFVQLPVSLPLFFWYCCTTAVRRRHFHKLKFKQQSILFIFTIVHYHSHLTVSISKMKKYKELC